MKTQQATRAAVTSMTYPGRPASVRAARRLVRGVLAGSPLVDDLELIVSELATNAIRHTPSGWDGGMFTITIRYGREWRGSRSRMTGMGSGLVPARDAAAEGGRGLMLAAALADKLGCDVTRTRRQVVWAQVTWERARNSRGSRRSAERTPLFSGLLRQVAGPSPGAVRAGLCAPCRRLPRRR